MYIIHVERSMICINRPIAMVMDHWCKNIVTVSAQLIHIHQLKIPPYILL